MVPSGDLAGVTLVLEEPGPGEDLWSWLEQRVAEADRLAAQPDPLRLALQDPQLDEAGRAVLHGWLDEQARDRAADRALLGLLER
jgi:hypothetical protein